MRFHTRRFASFDRSSLLDVNWLVWFLDSDRARVHTAVHAD